MAQLTHLASAAANNGTGSTNTGTATSASFTRATDDFLVAFVVINVTTAGEDMFSTINAPAGWNVVPDNSSNGIVLAERLGDNLHTAIKTWRASSAATGTLALSAGLGGTRKAAIGFHVFRGVDTANPPVVVGTVYSGVEPVASVAPSGLNSDDTLLHLVGVEGVRTVSANTSGFTPGLVNSSSGGGSDTTKVTVVTEYDLSATEGQVGDLDLSAAADLHGWMLQIKTATPAAPPAFTPHDPMGMTGFFGM